MVDGNDTHGAVPALANPAVSGITRLSATDTVRARIALAIELGLMVVGEQLPSDHDVAAALGVSEITARRALKSLADEGVLARRRGRTGGTFVAEPGASASVASITAYLADAADVHRLIDERVLLECALVHHAALNISAGQLDVLDEAVAQAATAENWTDYHAADARFHLGVAAASGLDWALPQYAAALNALYRYFLPYPVDYLHGVNREHARLVAALREHDPVAAVAIIRQHVSVLHDSMFVGLAAGDPRS
ncbi:FadR family transcriptional regulator [Cryobacterium sp. TMT1-3]|uniref:FadR family transcriptional regulator n=1 Tax=Cryobacterium luteum TaxID=1424661 RepID=A0A1H8K7S5_9MICO|nr:MULTISPECIES: FCD domain-containing protein [Cryobacterium]TFB92370.1 FadR family transcriptional regulator [Cryobacterium luteum]TFC25074.1 FadR family transcriptional regulator [Cryobacterium sp. TMT1-3]SEN89070.1 DNA-binding transcriptional regulator, FadR family [Cryobacterium luteum]